MCQGLVEMLGIFVHRPDVGKRVRLMVRVAEGAICCQNCAVNRDSSSIVSLILLYSCHVVIREREILSPAYFAEDVARGLKTAHSISMVSPCLLNGANIVQRGGVTAQVVVLPVDIKAPG